MPGPQLLQAVAVCRAFREKYPRVPIVWGGYFASLYTEAALNARYVDFVVKGQGEDTLLELLDALRGRARFLARPRHLVQGPVRPARAHRRAPAERAGRFSVAAVPSPGPGEVHRAHVSGLAHGGPPGQHRLPVPLQFLRRGAGVRPREDGIAGAHRRDSRPPAGAVRRQRGAVLRQQLLPARRPRARTGRPHRAAQSALVVRSARRYRAGLLRRYAAQTARRRAA